jgi:hypothetical protein
VSTTSFTLGAGRFPVGTTVGVYARRTMIEAAGPVGGTEVTSAVTSAGLTTTFTGLAWSTEYWAAAEVGGVWRKVAFTTVAEPEQRVVAAAIDGVQLDVLRGSGVSVTSDEAGVYAVTFDVAFTLPPAVTITPDSATGPASVQDVTATGCTAVLHDSSSGDPIAANFTLVAVGR